MPVGRRDELQPDDKRFLELLDTVAGHNAAVKDQFALDRHVLAKRARALAELGVGNVQALAMLDVWVPAEHTRWVKADDVVEVSELLPGVRIDVLGPPTLQQVPELRSYASGSAEYWLGLAADGKIEPELQATVPDPEFQQRQGNRRCARRIRPGCLAAGRIARHRARARCSTSSRDSTTC